MNPPLRALLIDDNEDDRRLVIRELGQVFPGLQPREVRDPRELEAALTDGAFDLVITDYQLRWDNGLAILQRIKRDWPGCPVIMFTGTGSEEIAVEAMKSGLDDYVLKSPHHFIRLSIAVRSALERAEARRRAERAESDRAAMLERERVARLEAERLNAELRETDRRKDEFLAMLAHELRNPLAPISTAVELMRVQGHSELGLALDVVDRQVRHLVRLIDDLLDVSRVTRGKIELRREPLDLRDAVHHAVEISRPLIEARRHALTLDLPAEPLPLEADPTRLEQVFANLLNNAAKYTEEGGRILLEAAREGVEAVVRVRDTGIGIEPGVLPRVFDLFAQAERSLDRAQGGLGIGLTLVRHLVAMHEGRVEARSEGPGQGSEFIVRLPLRPRSVGGESSEPGRRSPLATTPRRLLVVDDHTDAAEMLARLLRAWGHDVRTAYDGPTALEAACAHRSEVVLLDIGLPGLNGYDVAQRLRQLPETAESLLVAVTGYGQEEDRRRAREGGFDHYLVKPLTPETLAQILDRPEKVRRHTAG